MGGAPSGHLWVFITFLLLLLSSKVNLLLHYPRLTCLCRFTFFSLHICCGPSHYLLPIYNRLTLYYNRFQLQKSLLVLFILLPFTCSLQLPFCIVASSSRQHLVPSTSSSSPSSPPQPFAGPANDSLLAQMSSHPMNTTQAPTQCHAVNQSTGLWRLFFSSILSSQLALGLADWETFEELEIYKAWFLSSVVRG
jgi:hypothetical protein